MKVIPLVIYKKILSAILNLIIKNFYKKFLSQRFIDFFILKLNRNLK